MPALENDEPGLCAGCGGKIVDRYYLLAIEKQWHMNCLKCAECHIPLDSELTCFAKDGHVFCKEDYYRLFATKRCARCHLGISSNELVMRARDFVYHLNCFTCVSCNKILATGEHFGMNDNMIFCKTHYEMALQSQNMPFGGPPPPFTCEDEVIHHVPFYNGVGATQKGRPRKRKSPAPDIDPCNPTLGGMDPYDLGHPDMFLQNHKQKRMRTSFKHHQLRTMKSYFQLNQNPDAKDLKQLAERTGLNKRVLQVWFQNARAKYRRTMMKGDPSGVDKNQNHEHSSKGSNSDDNTRSGSDMCRSPEMSDNSSNMSLPDLHNGSHLDQRDSFSNASISELFASSVGAMS